MSCCRAKSGSARRQVLSPMGVRQDVPRGRRSRGLSERRSADEDPCGILGRRLTQSSRICRSAICQRGKPREVSEVMMKRLATRRALLAGAALAAMLGASAFAADKPTMGVVVKIGGIPWFNAMEMGIKEEGAKDGVDAFMVGPTSADPSLQVRA